MIILYILLLSVIIRFLPLILRKIKRELQYRRKQEPTTPTIEADTNITDTELDKIIEEYKETSAENTTDYTGRYQKKLLLTKNEWYEYKKLKKLASCKGLQVCPKVRLLDLIEPRRGDPKYKTLFYKIQAKHIDFVICDQNLYVKAILELDDSSHDSDDRKTRDEFVDLILKDVGYTVIRTRSITDNTLDCL